jgi:hypothetical protein
MTQSCAPNYETAAIALENKTTCSESLPVREALRQLAHCRQFGIQPNRNNLDGAACDRHHRPRYWWCDPLTFR